MYSYKNCYGLSYFFIVYQLYSPLYSYKNCYGLSSKVAIVHYEKYLYSYKNCYGLSQKKKYRKRGGRSIRTKIVMVYPRINTRQKSFNLVFVQKLLWFIHFRRWLVCNKSNVFVQKLLWFIFYLLRPSDL